MVRNGHAMKEFPTRAGRWFGPIQSGVGGVHQRRSLVRRESVAESDVVDGFQLSVEVLRRADIESSAGEGLDDGGACRRRSRGVVL